LILSDNNFYTPKDEPMKKAIVNIVLLIGFLNLAAQQLPVNNQYMINRFSLNPAYGGYNSNIEAFASYRRDWLGIPGAPEKAMLNANLPILTSSGIGISVMNEQTGNFEYFSSILSYSHHLKISRKSNLSFGIGAEFYRNQLDLSNVKSQPELQDPFLTNNQSLFGTTLDVCAGVAFHADALTVGLVIPRAIGMKVNYQKEIENRYSLSRHFLIHGSYLLTIDRNFEIEPSVVVRMTQNSPLFFEVSTMFTYKERVWGAVTYRKGNAIGISMGGALDDKFVLNYSYEFGIGTGILAHSSGTHEISIGYLIKEGKEKRPTAFPKQKQKQAEAGVDKEIIKKLKEELEAEIKKSQSENDQELTKLTTRIEDLEKRLKEQDIEMYGPPYVLKNIQFGHNSHILFASSYPELDKLAKKLKDNPTIEIKISGHTDNEGSPKYNLRLSENRAKSVKEYIVSKGIDEKRIITEGFGETKPIASNETREGKAQNRRIEVQEKK